MIPPVFLSASWYCTLPVHEGYIAFAVKKTDGEVVRLQLPVSDARHLIETLSQYLEKD